jgi:hypothetical protein
VCANSLLALFRAGHHHAARASRFGPIAGRAPRTSQLWRVTADFYWPTSWPPLATDPHEPTR